MIINLEMEFLADYLKVVDKNISNDHKDNWDHYRYGQEPAVSLKAKVIASVNSLLYKKGFFNLHGFIANNLDNALKFKFLYEHLGNAEDKELLLAVLAYHSLGYKRVRLPLSNPGYWSKLKEIELLGTDPGVKDESLAGYKIKEFDITSLGYPLKLYYSAFGIMIDFIVKQYEYSQGPVHIKAERGDVVIDAGGCWGDTAVYFANEVGSEGKVYSFEFIPKNIHLFQKNVQLNRLEGQVELLPNPVWKDSATRLYYKDRGPGSSVKMEPFEGYDGTCMTLSIDDLVAQKGLQQLNFIKMDIEGAETDALKGAQESIKKFKPKLAIALYHSYEDFDRIPRMINEMGLGYRFYFSHSTIYDEESMLFAIAE